jgi:uncharacterized protein YjbI with pentapeptide repeats
MLTRILIAVAAIGAMSLTAFAQTRENGTPEQNAVARKATAQRLIDGEKSCTGCDIFQVDLSYQELTGRDLSGARIRQADLSLSTFDHTKFVGADMSIVNAFGIKAEDADFSNVNFADAVLVGGWFGRSHFAGAKFDNANISGSDFSSAIGLSQSQLNTACGDSETRLPKGLTVVACKADVALAG